MKTIQEKAKRFAKQRVILDNRKRYGDESSLRSAEYDSYKSYVAGFKEAMRWRDPINEPPERNVSVFVKYETTTGKLKYGVGRYVPLGIGNDWTVEGSTSREIIGWRPVEEDSL